MLMFADIAYEPRVPDWLTHLGFGQPDRMRGTVIACDEWWVAVRFVGVDRPTVFGSHPESVGGLEDLIVDCC